MASLQDIRKRIKSVKNTQKITRAMKMVAAAKLRRAQEAAEANKAYTNGYQRLVQTLLAHVEEDAHPLLGAQPGDGPTEVVMFTSDRGLCGGFNAVIVKRLAAFAAEHDEELVVTAVGAKGRDSAKRKFDVTKDLSGEFSTADLVAANALAEGLRSRFLSGEVQRVVVLYNRFDSIMTQTPVVEQILPLPLAEGAEEHPADMLFEPDPVSLLDYVLQQRIVLALQQAALDTGAGEQASRMTAMDSATKNAGDMIDDLTLTYNRARQAAITSDLVEIISGAEAL
jgi:F-type H+-transporting ATPase subunit gamma